MKPEKVNFLEKLREYAGELSTCVTEEGESLVIIGRDTEENVLVVFKGEVKSITTSIATAFKNNPSLIKPVKIAVMMAELALEKQEILENNNSQ
jgi:hypothetical protein